MGKKFYTNGQKIYELIDDNRTYFFKKGKIRAAGLFVSGLMECEWIFYHETREL